MVFTKCKCFITYYVVQKFQKISALWTIKSSWCNIRGVLKKLSNILNYVATEGGWQHCVRQASRVIKCYRIIDISFNFIYGGNDPTCNFAWNWEKPSQKRSNYCRNHRGNVLGREQCSEWFTRLTSSCQSTEDDRRSWRLSISTDEVLVLVRRLSSKDLLKRLRCY